RADYEVLKVDIESLDTISFGGFLMRMAKGSHIVIDAEHVNNEVWMPAKAVLRGSVRIALIKVIRGEVSFTFSNYKKAAVVSAPPLPCRAAVPSPIRSGRRAARPSIHARRTPRSTSPAPSETST